MAILSCVHFLACGHPLCYFHEEHVMVEEVLVASLMVEEVLVASLFGVNHQDPVFPP